MMNAEFQAVILSAGVLAGVEGSCREVTEPLICERRLAVACVIAGLRRLVREDASDCDAYCASKGPPTSRQDPSTAHEYVLRSEDRHPFVRPTLKVW